MRPSRRVLSVLAIGLPAALLSACSSIDPISSRIPEIARPYRPDLQQGNWVTRQQVEQLRVGMTRDQVRFVLGSPTLTDIFHGNRWEYPYVFREGKSRDGEQRRFTVFFDEQGRLARWAGDELPSHQPFATEQAPQTTEARQ